MVSFIVRFIYWDYICHFEDVWENSCFKTPIENVYENIYHVNISCENFNDVSTYVIHSTSFIFEITYNCLCFLSVSGFKKQIFLLYFRNYRPCILFILMLFANLYIICRISIEIVNCFILAFNFHPIIDIFQTFCTHNFSLIFSLIYNLNMTKSFMYGSYISHFFIQVFFRYL